LERLAVSFPRSGTLQDLREDHEPSKQGLFKVE